MSYVLDILQDGPAGHYMMDDTSPVQDYSISNGVATITGTPVQHAGLIKGAAWAPVFTSTVTCAFPNTVFLKNFEVKPFTLVAAFRVIDAAGTGDQQILGNSGQMDGITVNGKTISFVTKYTSSGEARVTYTLQQNQEVLAHGVHTDNKNSLYIDGVLVGEVILTQAQQADTYASTSANLICGTTAGSQKVAVNGVAYYNKALTGGIISRQFAVSRDVPSPLQVIKTNLGEYIDVDISNSDFFLDYTVTDEDQWNRGVFNNTAVVNDQLVPTFNLSTSVAGYWYNSIDLNQANAATIYGVILNWEGQGATVEVSVDGTTWESVTRGIKCTTIPAGYNPTNKVLQIRVGFPGGIVDDKSFIDNLDIVGLTTGVTRQMAGRTITYTGASPKRDYSLLAYHDNFGVEIPAGGTAVISADTLTAQPARTLELAIKRQGANPTISMTGTTYQNGAVATATLVDGQWTIMHVVAAADVTGTITINGPCIVGYVGIYNTALSAGTIASIYSDYVGTDAPRWSDSSVLSITEASGNCLIYAYDWSISSTG